MLVHLSLLCRFHSKLSAEYGIGTKKKPVVYCGRGRPPKKALMNMPTDGQVRLAYDVIIARNEVIIQEGGGEESSGEEGEDPDDQRDNKAEEEEYSDEHSDEEVSESRVKSLVITELINTIMSPQTPTEREELQKRIKSLKKVHVVFVLLCSVIGCLLCRSCSTSDHVFTVCHSK